MNIIPLQSTNASAKVQNSLSESAKWSYEVKLFIYFLMQVNVVSVLTKHWKKNSGQKKEVVFITQTLYMLWKSCALCDSIAILSVVKHCFEHNPSSNYISWDTNGKTN